MRITYLFDPLCGWCYGGGPALEQLASHADIELTLAPTGLFAGEGARPMDAALAAFAWQNDQRISRLTGRVFSETYRQRILDAAPGAMFDSAPATLGVVAVGIREPHREFEALEALQRARYVDGRENTTLEAVAGILDDAGFAEAAGRIRTPNDELLTAYRHRIETARSEMTSFAARGVPALLVGDGAARRLLPSTALFGGFEALTAQLQALGHPHQAPNRH